MTSPQASDLTRARRLTMLLSVLAGLFCWGVALVVGGTSGIVLAVLGLLGLIPGMLGLRRAPQRTEP